MNSSIWRLALRILGTWFGCGRAPLAPGTVGTLGALPLVWLLAQWGHEAYLASTLVFVIFSIFVAHFYEQLIATRHDPPEFVIDEVAGFLVTMAWVPLTLTNLCVGFVLFRILDALKPFPISVVDRKVPGGLGAISDDLLAGVVSSLILQWILRQGVLG